VLSDEPVDIVHFISPGHYNGERGAIVLAQRPDSNLRHGDVIGAAELAGFFDQLGCSVMGFSSPEMPQWVAGQRALAFELSWLRPGPILLSETPFHPHAAIRTAYQTLLGSTQPIGKGLAEHEPMHLCLHPALALEPTGTAPPGETAEPSLEDKSQRLAPTYLRNLEASLSETRDLSPVETWGQQGAREALGFLSSLVSMRGQV
jgi:hypothetical protein